MLLLPWFRVVSAPALSCACCSRASATRPWQCALWFFLAFSSPLIAQTATTTTLAITSSNSAVTSVASGTVVTLTATVQAGSTPVTHGQVNFCDASATYCEDIHIVGSAQLNASGIATIKFRPAIGSHTYKAAFAGTKTYKTSASAASPLSVPGSYPTTTTMTSSENSGNYTFSATVTGSGGLATAPSGTVSFIDTSNSSAVLGTGTLSSSALTLAFANSSSPATGVGPEGIASGDFNGDGIPDLAIANSDSNFVTILLGNGDGTFRAAASNPQLGAGSEQVVAADFNGDGIPDLAVSTVNSASLTILLGNGDGTFTAAASTSAIGSLVGNFVVGDFNQDGIPDIAAISERADTVTILLGNGDGTFAAVSASPATGTVPTQLAVGDFNSDGIPDLAVANAGSSNVMVLLGNGDGTFTPGATMTVSGGNPTGVAVADFNGDGIPDLAVPNDSGIAVYLGNGSGTFTSAAGVEAPTDVSYDYIVAGNFNGSATPGLAVVAIGDDPAYSVDVFLGNGNGGFSPVASYSNGIAAQLAAGDFTGKGLSDLAVLGTPLSVTVLLMEPQVSATASATAALATGTGTHQVEATYGGDSNYTGSVSSTVPVSTLIPTTLTLGQLYGSVTAGQTITLTATLSPSSQSGYGTTDGGTVTFYNGATALGTGTLTGGVATFTTSPLFEDTSYTFTAKYAGNANFAPSTSNEVGAGVIPIATALSLTVSPGAPAIAQPVTLTATLTPYVQGSLSTNGEVVSFYRSGTFLGVGSLNNGVAALTLPSLGAGSYTFTASFGPDNYFGQSGASASFTIPQDQTSLSLNVSPTSAAQGQPVTLTATLSGSYAPSTNGEKITFYDNGSSIGSGSITSGVAGLTISNLAGGQNNLSAGFAGDTNDTASSSSLVVVNVTPAATQVTPAIVLTSSANPVLFASALTFTATLKYSGSTPTGSVSFYEGSTLLAEEPVNASGVATCSFFATPAGTNSITAAYSGDSNYTAVTSSALSEVIQLFTVNVPSGQGTSATVSPGGQAAYMLAFSPPGGSTFPAPITLSVAGLPAGATATFSPSTIPAGSPATNVSLTVTVPSISSAQLHRQPFGGGALPAVLGLILLPLAGQLRKRARDCRKMLFLLVLGIAGLAAVAGLASCGAASGGTVSGSNTNPQSQQTQPQTFTLTVTATSGSTANTVALTMTVE